MKSQKIYVKVSSDFDSVGYMLPRSITWQDGRVFQIEEIRDFRPASDLPGNLTGDCFTVVIRGKEKRLFFEKARERFSGRFGRWFVEGASSEQTLSEQSTRNSVLFS